ncbi:extracellular solute-binding protein [Streptomyces alkaliterrae]|uniref:Extracellular solute-binding protein n=1 Tax=Streptomyces alkaliterrae TaxID=2213162 RepID=A0A5P0YRS1_9ACTN|nr:extracellular solute-binding protein [Streptomyces alkaliterrae]MBB1252225.1 extracellular solute-binding protein [Streptomyces alkaliterrae]MBB1260419.1 extracellular solute-binding protein [Streptomyces alkaliterrae]MQS02142.1 extracellular solute-binding protein [Streptomyces alkaliterrae]
MRRGIGITALVAALALSVTACGSDDDKQDKGSGELSGTITFWDTSNDAEKAVYKKIAEDFTKLHPKVKVKHVSVDFGEANNKFKNAAPGKGGGAPDVMRTEVAWVADFANLDYLAPLDGTPAIEDQDDYLPTAWGSTQFNGKTYAVPQVTDTLALFYNKKLLKEAGVEVPQSLEDVKKSAKKIKDKTGATALYLRGDDPYWFLPYLYGEGGDMLDADAKKVTIDQEAGVKAFAAMKDLVDSKAALTDLTDGWDNGQTAFKNGDVAMMINGPWAIEDSLSGKQFKDKGNLGVAAVPAGSKAQGAPQGGWNLSVYAGSRNLDASYEFVKYMSSPEVQQRTTEELSLLPTRKSVYDVDSVKKNEMVQFFKPAVDKAVERPWIAEGNSLFEPIKVSQHEVLAGTTSPKDAAKKAGDAYRKILKDWK